MIIETFIGGLQLVWVKTWTEFLQDFYKKKWLNAPILLKFLQFLQNESITLTCSLHIFDSLIA